DVVVHDDATQATGLLALQQVGQDRLPVGFCGQRRGGGHQHGYQGTDVPGHDSLLSWAIQSFTVPSPLAEASNRPSGEKATAQTGPRWPGRTATFCPVCAPHPRPVRPSPPEASSPPPKARACTWPWWPRAVARCRPVAVSQTFSVAKWSAVAAVRPSGASATLQTGPVWTRKGPRAFL